MAKMKKILKWIVIGTLVILITPVLAYFGFLTPHAVRSWVISADDHQKIKVTQKNIYRCKRAIEIFQSRCGRLPSNEEQLLVLLSPPDKCVELPEIEASNLVDGWGNRLIYEFKDHQNINILSYGKDGKKGGSFADADIELRQIPIIN